MASTPWEKYSATAHAAQANDDQATAMPWERHGGKPQDKPSGPSLGDAGKAVASGFLEKGIGSMMQFGGEVLRQNVNKVSEGFTGEKLLEQQAVNPVESLSKTVIGTTIDESRSDAAKDAQRKSTPTGDLTDPSSWTLGKDPTLGGYIQHGANLLGQAASMIAPGVALKRIGGAAEVVGAMGGAQTGGAALAEESGKIRAMSHEQLLDATPKYQEYLDKFGGDQAKAKEALAQDAGYGAGVTAFVPGALGGGAMEKLIAGKLALPTFASQVPGAKMAGRVMSGAALEGVQEVAEGVAQRAGANLAAGTKQDVMEGTFGEFALGTLGGGAFGTAFGHGEHASDGADISAVRAPINQDAQEPLALPSSLPVQPMGSGSFPVSPEEAVAAQQRVDDVASQRAAYEQQQDELRANLLNIRTPDGQPAFTADTINEALGIVKTPGVDKLQRIADIKAALSEPAVDSQGQPIMGRDENQIERQLTMQEYMERLASAREPVEVAPQESSTPPALEAENQQDVTLATEPAKGQGSQDTQDHLHKIAAAPDAGPLAKAMGAGLKSGAVQSQASALASVAEIAPNAPGPELATAPVETQGEQEQTAASNTQQVPEAAPVVVLPAPVEQSAASNQETSESVSQGDVALSPRFEFRDGKLHTDQPVLVDTSFSKRNPPRGVLVPFGALPTDQIRTLQGIPRRNGVFIPEKNLAALSEIDGAQATLPAADESQQLVDNDQTQQNQGIQQNQTPKTPVLVDNAPPGRVTGKSGQIGVLDGEPIYRNALGHAYRVVEHRGKKTRDYLTEGELASVQAVDPTPAPVDPHVHWNELTNSEREQALNTVGTPGIYATRMAEKPWAKVPNEVRKKLVSHFASEPAVVEAQESGQATQADGHPERRAPEESGIERVDANTAQQSSSTSTPQSGRVDSLVQPIEQNNDVGANGEPSTKYRRDFNDPPPANGMKAPALDKSFTTIRRMWKNAPEIVVVQDWGNLPERALFEVMQDGAFGAKGLYLDGKVYIIAENNTSLADAQFTLLHEVLGHAGLRGVFGNSLEPLLLQLYAEAPSIKARADQLIEKSKEKDGVEMPKAVAVEEVLADAAARGNLPAQTWFKRIVAAFRNFLRQRGFHIKMEVADVVHMLESSRRFIEGGNGGSAKQPRMGAMMQPAYQRESAPMGQRARLFELPGIAPVELSGIELGENLSKKELAKAADRLLREIQKSGEALHNSDTGWNLLVNKMGRQKMGDNPELSEADNKAAAGIRELVQRAVLAESHVDAEHRNPDVQSIHRLYAPADIGGKLYRIKLTVKDYAWSDGTARKNLHAIESAEIENAPKVALPAYANTGTDRTSDLAAKRGNSTVADLTAEIENAPMGTVPSYSGASALQTAQPTSGRIISIADLLRGAIRDGDGQAFAPDEALRYRDFDPNDPLTWLDFADDIEVTAPGIRPWTSEEIKRASDEFLSHFPEGSRYPPDTRLLARVRRASARISDELGGSEATARAGDGPLGPFTSYFLRGEVTEPDDFNPKGSLQVYVYGKEQRDAGLTDEPALTFTVTADGELTVNGPFPDNDTFRAFKQRGWADYAHDASGEPQLGWSALKDPARPGETLPLSQVLPLLADVHARTRIWKNADYIGLHWSRATGALGGLAGMNAGNATAAFFRNHDNAITAPVTDWLNGSKAMQSAAAMADRLTGRAAADIPAHVTAGQAEALRKIGAWVGKESIADRTKALASRWQEKLVQGVFDQFRPLKDLDERAYMQARLSKGTDGAVESVFLHGLPVMEDGAINVPKANGGLRKVLADLGGEHDLFFAWVAGNRSKKLRAEGRERLFTDEQIAELIRLNEGKMADGRARALVYAKVHAQFRDYQKAVLDIAAQAGLIDAEGRELWESDFYVPFYRVMEEDSSGMAGPGQIGGLVGQRAFKKLKGGEEPLGDLLSNTLSNWSHLLSASMKNMAADRAIRAAEAMGIASKAPAAEAGSVRIMRNGKEAHFQISDPLVLDALTMLHHQGWNNPAMKSMRWFKHALTTGVTMSPTFRVRNLIRDSLSAMAINDMSFNPLRNVKEGFLATGDDSMMASLLAGGGVIRFGSMNDGGQAVNAKRLIADLNVSPDHILDGQAKIKRFFGKAWERYQEFGDKMEAVNRAALYKKLRAEGKDHLTASFMARDMMDFTAGGKWAAVRFLTQIVPFMNARLQGMYKLGRGAQGDPRRFMAVAGAVALASVLLHLLNDDDEDYQKLPDWVRNTYWWVRLPGMDYAVFIPKPFEIGALGTVAERSVELATAGNDYRARDFAATVGSLAWDTLAMNPVPQAVKPAMEAAFNRDSFRNRDIDNQGQMNLPAEDRYTANTSAAAVAAGQLLNVSPQRIEHLVKGYFGWLGIQALNVGDLAARPIMDLPDKPERRVADAFVIGDFVKEADASTGKYLSRFYEQQQRINEVYAAHKFARDTGDMERAKELAGDNHLRLRFAFNAIGRQIAAINQRMKAVSNSPHLDEQEKRQLLDELGRLREDRARQGDELARRAA